MPRVLGDAIVVISPDTRYFRTLADAQIRKELAGINPQVRIGLDQKSAQTALAAFQARVRAVSDQLHSMRMDVKNDKAAEAKILAAQARVLALAKAMANMTMAVDTRKLDAQILAKQAEVRKLQASMSGLQMDANSTKLALKIARLEAQAKDLEEQLTDMDVDADVSVLEAKFNAVHSELALLKRDASDIDLVMTNVAALRNIAVAKAELTSLQEQARRTRLGTNIDPAKLVAAEAGLIGIEAAMQKLDETTKKSASDSNAFVGIISGTRWWNISILGVGAWHVVLDGLLETLIAVIGATIALSAGVLAMADSAKDVGIHLKGVLETSAALHQTIPPLTGNFKQLSNAMAPRTIEAFGGGLALMRTQSGNLLHEMEPVVNLFDTWIAKIDLWVGSQHQFGKAISGGLVFLSQFGQILGNLGMAISNLLSKDPGIAQMLGGLIIFGTQLLVAFSKLPAPLVETALALHGIYLWGKVLIAAPILAFAKSLGILSAAQVKTAENALHFRNILSFFLTNPFGWAIGAAAGLALLGYQLAQADVHARNFIADLEQGLQQLSGGAAILQISADVGQLNAQIAGVPARIGASLLSVTDFAGKAGRSFNQVSYDLNQGNIPGALTDIGRTAYNAVRAFEGWANIGPQIRQTENDTAAYRGEIIKLTREQSKMFAVTGRLVTGQNDLHIGTVSLGQAWALMSAAGVKASDSFAVMWQKVENLVTGYKGLSIQGGILKNSVNAISFAALQQESKVSDLNGAWDAFFKTVTGGETGFLSFAQQTIGLYRVMGDSAVKMNESSGKVSIGLRGIQQAGKGTVISMTGLNDASINARNTFLQSAEAANTQVDNLTLLASAAGLGAKGTGLLQRATQDMVASLLPAAAKSQALTDVLYALAQRGGYGGANSFRELSKWAGRTKNPLQDLDKITTTLTTDASNLTNDVKNLSAALGQTLNDAMAKALLQAGGGQKVFDDFATALHKGFTGSNDQKAAALALGDQLLLLTGNTKDAHNEFDTFAQQMNLTRAQADQLWHEIQDRLTPTLISQAAKVLPNLQNSFASWADHGLNYSRGKANDLWAQIVGKLHPQLDALGNLADGPAKNKFISWAENGLHLSQTKAQNLWKELVTLQGHIDNLHGKTFAIVMQAHGYVTVSDGKQTFNISQGAWNSPHAAGGRIPGFAPGVDNYPALLSGGEYIFTPEAASAIGYDRLDQINQMHARKRLGGARGFASGGLAGMPDAWPGQAAAGIESRAQADTGKGLSAALAEAVKAAMKMALAAGSGPAVLRYAEKFIGTPYVWGGSTPAGWDCSGFVSYVYDHFKLFSGRTDAAGLQRWARPSAPTPGGMAFYGFPAHHVGFVVNGNTLLSALGRKWGTTETALNMGDNSGYGVPPQGFGKAGGGPAGGSTPKGKLQELAFTLLSQYGWASQWAAFNDLETREAGWNMRAVNPGSGAAGLAQFINGWSEYFQYGGNPSTGLGQLTAMMNYIASRWGSPAAADANEIAHHFYKNGGLVGIYDQGGILPPGGMAVNMTRQPEQVLAPAGMASGGAIPLARYLPQLKAAQHNEYSDYLGLRKAYLADLAHARTGSWTSGHRAGIKSELATLAKRQSAEEAAYDNILHHGTARANLSKFTGRIRAVVTTSRDKDLAHSHPSWTHGLQHWLGVLTHLSQANVAPVYGGTQAKLLFPAWIARARAAQAAESYDYRGLQAAFKAGLTHARHDTWLYKNRKAIGERLYALAVRQNAEAAAWNDLNKHSSGSVSDLAGLAGRIGKLGAQARAETGAIQPALLGHVPGGHPGWVKALQAQLKLLTSLAAVPPFNPPWAPGNLGPSHTVPGGVLRFARGGMVPVRSFDSGGLWPSGTLGWNGSGHTETVTPAGAGPSEIHLHVHNNGVIASQQQSDAWLQASLNRMARTGYLSQAVSRATGR